MRRTFGELSANFRRTWTSGQSQRFSCHGPPRSAKFMAVEMGERARKLGVSRSRSRVGEFGAERGNSVGETDAFGAVFGPLSRGLWRGRDRRPKGAKSRGKGRRNGERREFTLSASRVNCWVGSFAPDGQAPRVGLEPTTNRLTAEPTHQPKSSEKPLIHSILCALLLLCKPLRAIAEECEKQRIFRMSRIAARNLPRHSAHQGLER